MNEPFLVFTTVQCAPVVTPRLDPAEVEVLAQVNQTLATELSGAQKLILLQDKKIDDLTKKMSKVSIRNVNKKLRRREGQTAALTQEVKKRKRLSIRLKKIESNSERYRINLHNLKKISQFVSDKVQQLENKI